MQTAVALEGTRTVSKETVEGILRHRGAMGVIRGATLAERPERLSEKDKNALTVKRKGILPEIAE